MRIKTHFILLLLAVFTLPPKTRAEQKYEPLPTYLDGSMMPYDFSRETAPTALPDSLRPVYASYVARHGARYLSGESKMKPVVDALEEGRRNGTLSSTGKDFLDLIDQIRRTNQGNWGDLSPEGFREERLLGLRLYNILTPLHDGTQKINAVSSYMPRVVMTMYIAMNSIIRQNDTLTVMTDEGHQYDRLVCCFMADPEFARYRKEGAWKKIFDKFLDTYVSPEPARRLFTDTPLSEHKLRKLTFDIYEVLKANRAAGLPAPTTQWMSVEEYEGCWRASNLQHYLRNTITAESSLAGKATTPLLRQIMDDIDMAAASESPQPVLNGYFGHAETLLPLLSLMQIPGCYDLTTDYDQLEKSWRVEDITPLGANLIILLSRGPSGRNYVTMQLNGRVVTPMPGQPEVVAWDDLKNFWNNLLINNP